MLKKLLLASAVALTLGGLAMAQTITSSLQGSQDPRGPVPIDTNSGMYFPGHMNNTGAAPTVTGTGSPTVSGSDAMGTITMGTSATTATLLFNKAYNSVPSCVVTASSGLGTVSPLTWTMATTSIAITQGSTSANKLVYLCMSAS